MHRDGALAFVELTTVQRVERDPEINKVAPFMGHPLTQTPRKLRAKFKS
jgi:hypothetical protein